MSAYRREDRGGEWWVMFRHHGKRIHRRSPEQSEAGARAHETELRRLLSVGLPLDATPPPTALAATAQASPPSLRQAPTLRDFWPRWFESYVEAHNRPSARAVKASSWRAHLGPALGDLRLDEITTARIDAFSARSRAAGLSPKTINNVLSMLRKCLTVAHEWGEAGPPPKIRWQPSTKPETVFLSPEESDRLLAAARAGLWKTLILFLLHTGARFGEAAGLRWEDLELTGPCPVVHIRHSATWGVLGPTKNGKPRDVPLTPELAQALAAWRHDRPFVFSRANGRLLRPSATIRYLHAFCRDAGVKEVGWHALRHTFATTLTARRVPLRAVQELLGHSSIEMTERYTHVVGSLKVESVLRLSAVAQSTEPPSAFSPSTPLPSAPQRASQAAPPPPPEPFEWRFGGRSTATTTTAPVS